MYDSWRSLKTERLLSCFFDWFTVGCVDVTHDFFPLYFVQFYEELVQGINSNLGQVELSEKPVNKKTVFKYSDSSSSEDEDEDGENGNDEDQTKKETSKIEQHQEKTDDEIDSLKTGESEPENKDNNSTELIQGNTENKEELENTLEKKDIEVGEPPAKRQCVEKEAAEAGNIAFGKTEEKSIDRLIDAELAELGDKSKVSGYTFFLLFQVSCWPTTLIPMLCKSIIMVELLYVWMCVVFCLSLVVHGRCLLGPGHLCLSTMECKAFIISH